MSFNSLYWKAEDYQGFQEEPKRSDNVVWVCMWKTVTNKKAVKMRLVH